MIRERIHIAAQDTSAWNRMLEVVDEANRLCQERGWPTGRPWTLVAGPFNEIVIDVDYVDLAQYERVQQETQGDPSWATMMKPVSDAMVVERSYNELLASAEPVL